MIQQSIEEFANYIEQQTEEKGWDLGGIKWTGFVVQQASNRVREQVVDSSSKGKEYFQVLHDLSQLFPETLPQAIQDYCADLLSQWCTEDASSSTKASIKIKIAALRSVDWQQLFHRSIRAAIDVVLTNYVSEVIAGTYDQLYIPLLKNWVNATLSPVVLLLQDTGNTNPLILLEQLNKKLMLIICKVRSNEMFEIIADFPDSIKAVHELKECATQSNSLPIVAKVLRQSICKRLLHPGASTLQIVELYVLMIRALRILDPSDLILTYVASPIRSYLKARKDTVRCVVMSLSQGTESELYAELRKGSSLAYGIDEDDEESLPVKNWEPRKRNPDLAESGTRGLDILALLVSIYGSIDLFVSEYRSLLAEKLLQNVSYQTDKEIATLELLKIRFGEDSLHSCEVMLRDIEESRRANAQIAMALKAAGNASNTANPSLMSCAIISDNYWPPLASKDGEDYSALKYHPQAQVMVDKYLEKFVSLKAARNLNFQNHLGFVDITLCFDDDAERKFSVDPVQANLIMYVSDKKQILLSELAVATELDASDIRKRMKFWVNKRVVTATELGDGGTSFGYDDADVEYVIIEDQQTNADADDEAMSEDADDNEFGVQSSAAQAKSKLSIIETYIKGILTNQGSISLDRLHTMLNMMVSDGSAGNSFDMTLLDLRRYLQTLIEADTIEFMDGMYRIRSSQS